MIPPLFGKQEVGIWRVQKCFPQYGVPIWSLWPYIRSLPSIVTEKNATKNVHICSMCIKINKVGKRGGRNPMVPKTLPTIWGTYMKLVTKYQISSINSCWEKCDEKCARNRFLDPSDSYFLFADFVDFSTHWTYMLIFRRIFLSNYWLQKYDIWSQASYQISAINSCWEKCDEKCAYMFNVYKKQLSRQTGSRNLMGPKTLPMIWGIYMTLVTKYQISVINSCWEKSDEKFAYMFNVYKEQLSRQTGSRNLTGPKTLPTIWYTYMMLVTKYCRLSWFLYTLNIYAHFSSHFSQQLLMAEIWYLVTSFI
jgi:hypothetical protein